MQYSVLAGLRAGILDHLNGLGDTRLALTALHEFTYKAMRSGEPLAPEADGFYHLTTRLTGDIERLEIEIREVLRELSSAVAEFKHGSDSAADAVEMGDHGRDINGALRFALAGAETIDLHNKLWAGSSAFIDAVDQLDSAIADANQWIGLTSDVDVELLHRAWQRAIQLDASLDEPMMNERIEALRSPYPPQTPESKASSPVEMRRQFIADKMREGVGLGDVAKALNMKPGAVEEIARKLDEGPGEGAFLK